jgi:hypothetical protein
LTLSGGRAGSISGTGRRVQGEQVGLERDLFDVLDDFSFSLVGQEMSVMAVVSFFMRWLASAIIWSASAVRMLTEEALSASDCAAACRCE